ncbi:MAG: hypothetical protein J6A63_02970 [Clostridia bacterium]|nr:hypothetical protein [Clostridia bacterium]
MKKVVSILGKIVFWLFFVVLCILLAVRVVDYVAFFPFYSNASAVCAMPGIHENYVPQGFDYDEEWGKFLATGYMSDKSESRVYVLDKSGNATYTKLLKANGKKYTGHTGGIAHFGEYVYITGGDTIDVFSYTDVKNGAKTTKLLGTVPTFNDPAYCYIYNGYLFAGSYFYETDDVEKQEHVTTPAGQKNTAIITVFKLDASKEFGIDPTIKAVISTKDRAQGMCFTADGELVLSTSSGLSVSQLTVYDVSDLAKTVGDPDNEFTAGEQDVFSLPWYYLEDNDIQQVISAPPMSEEVVYLDGKLYVMNESACNKYIFGKFTTGLWLYAYDYVK